MCDRHGDAFVDYGAIAERLRGARLGRRAALKATAAGALTLAMGPGLAQAQARGALRGTHGTGFCNLNFFLAHSLQLAREDGVEIQFVNTPTFAEQVTFLGTG